MHGRCSREDQVRERRITVGWTLGLALAMLIVAVLTWKWPMHVGQSVGSLTVACFSFGAFLALVNLAELVVTRLTNYAQQSGFSAQRSAVWAVLFCFLAVPAVLASLSHPFHRVRICGGNNECTPIAAKWAAIETPDKRPSISEAALAWYAQAEPAYHAIHPDEPVLMLIVATAGGGIQAAILDGDHLERLEDKLQWSTTVGASSEKALAESPLRNLLFAISGVSGGSIGAAAYAAAVHDHEKTRNRRQADQLSAERLSDSDAAAAWSLLTVTPICCRTSDRSTAAKLSSWDLKPPVRRRMIKTACYPIHFSASFRPWPRWRR